MKNTVATFQKMKENGEKISMLTCYDYSTAKLEEAAGINGILVGDSLGNVMLGLPDTLSVTMEHMITYGSSVARACHDTMVVIDMPFMSYQESIELAVHNAGRLMNHIGLTPQSINAFGGNKVQGKNEARAKELLEDAKKVQEAGAFALTLECVPKPLAALISKELRIPTIGIGAGDGCDGQILVYQDMLGLFSDYTPKFVQHFANLGGEMQAAFHAYDEAVKNGTFPDDAHAFKMDDSVLERLY